MKISRHPITPEDIQTRYDTTLKNLPLFLKGAKDNPNNLTLLASNALDVTSGGSVINPGQPEQTRWLEVAAQAIAGLFTVAAAPGGMAEVYLGAGDPTQYHRLPDLSLVHARRWVHGFSIAAISRDVVALDALCAFPPQKLRSSSTGCHEYIYQMVDAFRAYWLREPGVDKLLLRAMASTDTNQYEFHNPDYVLRMDVPLIELLFYVHRRDPDFETGLLKAIERHKSYWTLDGEKARDWDGFLAFGPLGMATLAFIREMPFDVESEYLPMSLVRGDHLS